MDSSSRHTMHCQAEKVSLEYLLQEKLEKMVQVEIEERVNLYRQRVACCRLLAMYSPPLLQHVNGDITDDQQATMSI